MQQMLERKFSEGNNGFRKQRKHYGMVYNGTTILSHSCSHSELYIDCECHHLTLVTLISMFKNISMINVYIKAHLSYNILSCFKSSILRINYIYWHNHMNEIIDLLFANRYAKWFFLHQLQYDNFLVDTFCWQLFYQVKFHLL